MADLKPANENPWYVLMTLYGEQDGEEVDRKLHEKNRTAWNAWACQTLDGDARQKLIEDGVKLPEDGAWETVKASVSRRHRSEMEKRNAEGFDYPGLPKADAYYDLTKMNCPNTAVLGQFIFTQAANFSYATFTQGASLVSARFTQYVDFSSATFTQGANFSYATFTQGASFISATFTQGASFISATFTQYADFSSATFTQGASFISATFTQYAYFISATFTQYANFSSARFTQYADFSSATFTQGASFISATFTQYAYFISATFTQYANFSSATFRERAYFTKAEFGVAETPRPALLDLTDAEIVKPASFRDARFLNRFPDFTGAIVNEKTIFPFQKHAWPDGYPLFDEYWKPEEHDRKRIALMREAANSCAFLRHHVKGQGLPEAEYLFFRREMGFLAQIGTWWQRLPYRLFGLSEYGTSISRPAYALLGMVLISALIFQCYFSYQEMIDPYDYGRFESLSLSFSNTFRFFGLQGLFFDKTIARLPGQLETLAAVQTICGFVGTFFLGLGLRARFRLR